MSFVALAGIATVLSWILGRLGQGGGGGAFGGVGVLVSDSSVNGVADHLCNRFSGDRRFVVKVRVVP